MGIFTTCLYRSKCIQNATLFEILKDARYLMSVDNRLDHGGELVKNGGFWCSVI